MTFMITDLQSMSLKSTSVSLRSTSPTHVRFFLMGVSQAPEIETLLNCFHKFSQYLKLSVIWPRNPTLFNTFPSSSISSSNQLFLLKSSWMYSFLLIIFIITMVQVVTINLPGYPKGLLTSFSPFSSPTYIHRIAQVIFWSANRMSFSI